MTNPPPSKTVTGESLQQEVNDLYEQLQNAGKQVAALTTNATQTNKNMKILEKTIQEQDDKYRTLVQDAKRMSQEFAEKQAETSAIIEEQAEIITRLKGMTPESSLGVQGYKRIKIGKLDKFDGDRKRIRAFLTGARRQMQVVGLHVASECDKVLYVSSFLEKDPETWFEPFLREYQTATPEKPMSKVAAEIFQDYSQFEKHLNAVFGNVDVQRDAATKIVALKQTGSVMKYATIFNQYKSFLSWNEVTLMDVFKQGLKPEVMKGIIYQDKEPKDLSELIERATKIDNAEFEVRQLRRSSGTQRNRTRKDKDGDVIMAGGASIDKRQARKDGLCFNCGQKGHMANTCPKKGSNQTGSKKSDPKTKEKANSAVVTETEIQVASMQSFYEEGHNSEDWYSADNEEGIEVQPTLEGTDYEISELEAIVHTTVSEVATRATELAIAEVRERLSEQLERMVTARMERCYGQDVQSEEAEVHPGLTERSHPSRTLDAASSEELSSDLPSYTADERPPDYVVHEQTSVTNQSMDAVTSEVVNENRWIARRRENTRRIRVNWRDPQNDEATRIISSCRCGQWKQQCFADSKEPMHIHEIQCDECYEWMHRDCPLHSRERKVETFWKLQSERYAGSVPEEYNEASHLGEVCLSAVKPWYICFVHECGLHRRIKEAMRCFPVLPRLVLLNANKHPCFRIGCMCSAADRHHPLHNMLHPRACEDTECFSNEHRLGRDETQRLNAGMALVKEDNRMVMRIKVTVEGKERIAMIDTGASKSIIGSHVINHPQLVPHTKMDFVDYTGQVVTQQVQEVLGHYMIEELVYRDQFLMTHIEAAAGYDMILGMNWLKKYYAIISCYDRTIVIIRPGTEGKVERVHLSSVAVSNRKGQETPLSIKQKHDCEPTDEVQSKEVHVPGASRNSVVLSECQTRGDNSVGPQNELHTE
jgi:hypothetical protein